MGDPADGMFLYHYDTTPVSDDNPLTRLQPGDVIYAVTSPDGTFVAGADVTVTPLVLGTPAQPVPAIRRRRFWCWLTRRPAPVTGEFTIGWGPVQPPAA